MLEEKLRLLPDKPGCYQMRNVNNEIIYVGKAKNLKNRVRSYFHGAHNAKTTRLVSEITDFTYVITGSELEALVLEINMIKEYSPKYNISLMDDKTYPYVVLTNEKHPRLIVTRVKKKKGFGKFFGPYPNVKAARMTVDLLNEVYPFRKCFNIPKKECLYYHLNQCLGPCINKDNIDYTEYKNKVTKFLNGDAKELLDEINAKMEEASNNLEFEKAIEYRNLKLAIEETIAKQKISINDLTSRDYIGIYHDNDKISINIIITRNGNVVQNHQTIINKIGDFEDETINYLVQYYNDDNKPKELCIKELDKELLESTLGISVYEAKLGKKKELLDMADYNAKFNLENKRNIYKNEVLKKLETIDELGELLGISTPRRIEAFDNSNLYGEYPVSAMVCYIDGKPAPKEFRKYHIKTVEGANDYASMKEVVYRRYFRLLMEDENMPDLIMMDGGMIQVNACKEVLESLGLEINVLGLQKNDKHKISKIYYEGELYDVDKNSNIFLLLADISERVHDFAISFFRSNKAKGLFSSILDPIEGLGDKRKEELLKHFINVDKIKEASIEELMEAKMPKNVAINIYNYFHEDNNDES